MMGGEIAAESRPGEGSLFRVALPLTRTDALNETARAAGPGARFEHADGLRVLLAEDHAVNQRVVQLILEPCGAEVTVVENGALAVEAFASGRYDVVLMDMQMPVMDGLAATRAIRDLETGSVAGRTPIIMLSANAMSGHRQEALLASKPTPVSSTSSISRAIPA
jgi:CheY-like chemotaxis protein